MEKVGGRPMKICDRSYALNNKTVKATHEVAIDSQVFHLCKEQHDLVLEFITNPEREKMLDTVERKVRETLRLPDKQQRSEMAL